MRLNEMGGAVELQEVKGGGRLKERLGGVVGGG